MATLRRTSLHERHEALGSTFGESAGWELPLEYSAAADEHLAVRNAAGVFDLGHLGQLAIKWSWAAEYLQARLTNDVDRLEPWHCQYTLLTDEDGGVVDDLILFRLSNGFMLTVNAANVARDLELLPELDDVSDDWGLLAIQGPDALDLLRVEVERFTFRREVVLGIECLISGTGYTGEPGCELLCNSADVGTLWDSIVELGVTPCGMVARESLRIEHGYLRHGNDLTRARDPYEAGMGRFVATSKNFVGVGPLRRIKRRGSSRRLVSFVMEDETVPASGASINGGGQVTSGAYSPVLERGIGLAYVWPGVTDPGVELEIDVDGETRLAYVHERSLLEPQSIKRKRGRVHRMKPPRPSSRKHRP